jgi:hypothetical protein
LLTIPQENDNDDGFRIVGKRNELAIGMTMETDEDNEEGDLQSGLAMSKEDENDNEEIG